MATKAKSVTLPKDQIVEVKGVFVRRGEYKEKPTISLSTDERTLGTRYGTSMTFGVGKAKMLLAAVPALKTFVETYGD